MNKIANRFSIEVPKVHKAFADFYWTAKMHKKVVAMRFIAASHKCLTKNLSKNLTRGLKGILNTLRHFCASLKRDRGIDHCWIIDSSLPVLTRIEQINSRNDFESVDTFDFKDLYTKIPHTNLKEKLKFVIELVFRAVRNKRKIRFVF